VVGPGRWIFGPGRWMVGPGRWMDDPGRWCMTQAGGFDDLDRWKLIRDLTQAGRWLPGWWIQ
jgi:hypothetical protein